MRYVFVDDSIPYDGHTSGRRPLGGPEKAVASLASALQVRGHDVYVINKAAYPHMADGAYYAPFGHDSVPKSADILIAVRKPLLLGAVRAAKQRVLWVMGPPDYLTAPANAALWDSFFPSLLFVSRSQAALYKGKLKSLVMAPAARAAFFETPPAYLPADFGTVPQDETTAPSAEPAPAPVEVKTLPPHAVVTTHPSQGLSWLLEVWREVRARVPEARLMVYSAGLAKGLKGEEMPAEIGPVLAQVQAAADAGVVVIEPQADYGMAEAYRSARVHLYPGNAQDHACWTLAESQAAGLPAVARGLGGTEERLVNGQTGFIVPDASAFANVTVEILSNSAVHRSLSAAAGEVSRRRTWSDAAAELDEFCAALPPSAR